MDGQHSQAGPRGDPHPEKMTQDIVILLRMARRLKLLNYFWNFPSNIFQLQLTVEIKIEDRGTTV